jgi:quinol monooxygenase YgiN
MFYENWKSKADLDAHLKMPHLKPLIDRVDSLLARPVEIKFYEMLSRQDF